MSDFNEVEGDVMRDFPHEWLDIGAAASRLAPSTFWAQ